MPTSQSELILTGDLAKRAARRVLDLALKDTEHFMTTDNRHDTVYRLLRDYYQCSSSQVTMWTWIHVWMRDVRGTHR